MKLKNEIFVNGFTSSLAKLLDKELDIELSYSLMKLVKEVDAKALTFNEAKMKLFNKHGDEKDGQIKVRPEEMEEFNTEMIKITSLEEDYSFSKVKLPKDIKISVKDLIVLDSIIEI